MSWAFLPHDLPDWSKASRQDRKDYAGTVSRLERMAQGLPPMIEDPAIYAQLAVLGLGVPAAPTKPGPTKAGKNPRR